MIDILRWAPTLKCTKTQAIVLKRGDIVLGKFPAWKDEAFFYLFFGIFEIVY